MNFESHDFDQFNLRSGDRYSLELQSADGSYPYSALYLPTEVGWFVCQRRPALIRLLKWLMACDRLPRIHIEGRNAASITATLTPMMADGSGRTVKWLLGPNPDLNK